MQTWEGEPVSKAPLQGREGAYAVGVWAGAKALGRPLRPGILQASKEWAKMGFLLQRIVNKARKMRHGEVG